MDFFYDGQIRRYITQFIRALSGFQYSDGQGNLKVIPVRFGSADKQAMGALRQNSENFLQQAPFISVYIGNLELSRSRMQDPNFVSKVHVTERDYDVATGNYTNTRGPNVTVERLMPNPYQLTLTADIWTTSVEQKLQILEQIIVLFNPAIELQTTSSYLDWTSLTTLELMDIQYTNQTIPSGDQEIEIASLKFMAPIWLSPPAKVKRQGVITSIIARVFDEEGNITSDILNGSLISQQVVTFDGYGILISNNSLTGTPQYVAKLLHHVEGVTNNFGEKSTKLGEDISWREVIERYPGKFFAGLSKIQVTKSDGKLASATLSLNSNDETLMNLMFSDQSLTTNTILASNYRNINSLGSIDAIVDPTKPVTISKTTGTRFLILEDISVTNKDYDIDQNNQVSYYQNININEPFYVADIVAFTINSPSMLNVRYTITTLGNTDFTAMGASQNKVGVSFVATKQGNGTGTVTRAGQPVDGQVLSGVLQWKDFEAKANDIIEWTGSAWYRLFKSDEVNTLTHITNAYTGIQYKWDGSAWTKSMEGSYPAGKWQIIL